jgi:RecB family exonuclease
MRGSFLGSERLVDLLRPEGQDLPGDVAAVATLNRLLEEERRLFYVAITRARHSLLVSAVASEREGLQPSRFLDELDPLPGDDARPTTTVQRPLSLAGLVAELRQTVTTPDAPTPLRRAAGAELARLALAGARGADPAGWWGLQPVSDDGPVHGPDDPVHVSPSKVESFSRCQLRWFLEHVGGTESSTAQQAVGTLVHAVAATALDPQSSTEAALLARLEALLPTADLGRGWSAAKEQAKARRMVRRLARWLAQNQRAVVATELAFAAGAGRAVVAGRVDRIERDDAGRAVVVDLKTGATKVPETDLAAHAQLAAYQLAAERGAFADVGLDRAGGAELVQLGKAAFAEEPRVQRQQPLSAYPDPGWAEQLVLGVADGMAGSAFRAMTNELCDRCPVRTACPVRDEGAQVTG